MSRIAPFALAVALTPLASPSSTPAAAAMSDPMGVFCIVDKVTLEPAEQPQRAQVSGVCAVANDNDWYFKPAARGYFYYTLPADQEVATRREWADLKSVAGTTEVVGWGRRYRSVGRFRAADEPVANPDVYPLNIGVVKISQYRAAPEVTDVVAKLRAMARVK
jgi:hypothetical protein